MAKRNPAGSHRLPGNPQAPTQIETPRYQKRSSYSPEQSDHDAYCSFYDRSAKTETPSELSPPPPTRNWGSGSYDEHGRPVSERGRDYGSGRVSAGQHTRGGPGKPSRPGRW